MGVELNSNIAEVKNNDGAIPPGPHTFYGVVPKSWYNFTFFTTRQPLLRWELVRHIYCVYRQGTSPLRRAF
jgi:hypothetical protein